MPLSERRGPITLGLLWLTMVTGFPSVLIGFEWYKAGLTLGQVLSCVLVSCLLLLVYAIPAAYLGARSGQTYGLLSRSMFGRWGSRLVSFNLVWVSIGWYGLTAIFLADGLQGLYHMPVPTVWLAAGLAVLMAFNNLFGFAGIANFARYLAAPVLILWVGFTFCKATLSCPATLIAAHNTQTFSQALTLVSSFVIGYSVWGNEPDYWRYGKPHVLQSVLPLVVSLAIGQVIFPTAGWMMAWLSGVTDYAAATNLMNQYAFGGMSIIAAVVLIVTYFAVNDSGLYGAINALENITEVPRQKAVIALTVAGVLTAVGLSACAHAFELVATLSSIILPAATVIMIAECFLFSRLWGMRPDFSRVPAFHELPAIRWPALLALLTGFGVGVATSGLIPGSEFLHHGVCSLQAWLAALVSYLVLRPIEQRCRAAEQRQILEKLLSVSAAAAPSASSLPGSSDQRHN